MLEVRASGEYEWGYVEGYNTSGGDYEWGNVEGYNTSAGDYEWGYFEGYNTSGRISLLYFYEDFF